MSRTNALGQYVTFLKELPKSFAEIGGIIPTSSMFAKIMVKPMKNSTAIRRSILEVGPGTGPITREILKLMSRWDKLVVCEINPRFVAELQQGLTKNRYYLRNRDRVVFFEGPVQKLGGSKTDGLCEKYDVIISSLPFSIFAPDTVNEILSKFRSLLKDGGSLTFIEYVGLRKLGSLFASERHRERVRGVEAVIKKWQSEVKVLGEVKTEFSILNIPPAKAIQFYYH